MKKYFAIFVEMFLMLAACAWCASSPAMADPGASQADANMLLFNYSEWNGTLEGEFAFKDARADELLAAMKVVGLTTITIWPGQCVTGELPGKRAEWAAAKARTAGFKVAILTRLGDPYGDPRGQWRRNWPTLPRTHKPDATACEARAKTFPGVIHGGWDFSHDVDTWGFCPAMRGTLAYNVALANLCQQVATFKPDYIIMDTELCRPAAEVEKDFPGTISNCPACKTADNYERLRGLIIADTVKACRAAKPGVPVYESGFGYIPAKDTLTGIAPMLYHETAATIATVGQRHNLKGTVPWLRLRDLADGHELTDVEIVAFVQAYKRAGAAGLALLPGCLSVDKTRIIKLVIHTWTTTRMDA